MAEDLAKKLQSLFLPAGAAFKPCSWCPPADIYEIPQGWMVKFDLAGIRFDDLDLTVRGRSLVLRGVRRDSAIEQGQRSYSMEISYSRFERSVTLPGEIDSSAVTTEYRDGMLVVRLPAKEKQDG